MKPKKNRKIIRMIIASLIVNVALAFCIAGLAFKFEKAPATTPPKAATTASDNNLAGKEDVSNESTEGFTKTTFSWLIPKSVIKKDAESLLDRK
jgi:uncharacterized membrane protein